MASVNLDFSSVANRDPLPEGLYLVQISGAEMKKSQSGNDMLSLEFDVLADSVGAAVEGSRKLWDNCSMLPQALFKLKNILESVGIDASGSVAFDTDELIGQQLQAKVVQEEYNGEMRNRVKKYFEV